MKQTEKIPSPNWGGKRPNAGRKPRREAVKKFPVCLPQEDVTALDEIAQKMGESRNSVIRRAILAFLGR
jgi:predicted HicB family RNase H-like nuclease